MKREVCADGFRKIRNGVEPGNKNISRGGSSSLLIPFQPGKLPMPYLAGSPKVANSMGRISVVLFFSLIY